MKKFHVCLAFLIILVFPQSILSQNTTSVKTRYHPPDFPVRAMAEWDESEGVLMAWNSDYPKLTPAFFDNLAMIIHQVQMEIPVFLLCTDIKKAQKELLDRGASISNIQFIQTEGLETPWCRDYGPLSVYSELDQSLHLIDWVYDKPHRDDDEMSIWVSHFLEVPLYKAMTSPYTLVNSGANMMFDGMGLAVLNTFYRKLLPERPEREYDTVFEKYMGVHRAIKIDLSHYHIDYFYKLINEETLLVEDTNPALPEKSALNAQNLAVILKNFKSSYGHPFTSIKLPVPLIKNQKADMKEEDYPSYLNSLIVNKVVFVPTYQCETDAQALKIYRDVMPGYKIIAVNCAGTYRHRGAIHCLTREIGVRDPIFIAHIPPKQYDPRIQGFRIEAVVKSKVSLVTINLFWKTGLMQKFVPIQMQEKNQGRYQAYIPSQPLDTHICYYLQAKNKYGKIINKPMVAPKGYWQFVVKDPRKKVQ